MKKKKAKKMTLREKCERMFRALHIQPQIGENALRKLVEYTARTKLPMPALAEQGLKFFVSMEKDEHASLLLAVFCLVYSRILLDPTIGCVMMSEEKGDDKGEKVDSSKTNKRIIIP